MYKCIWKTFNSQGCQVTESDKSKVLIAKKPKLINSGKDASLGHYYFTYTGSKDTETQQFVSLFHFLDVAINKWHVCP